MDLLWFVGGGVWSLACFFLGYWLKNGTLERVIERVSAPATVEEPVKNLEED